MQRVEAAIPSLRALLGTGLGVVLALAFVKVLLNLAAWDRYGFHRDEWYYITGGLHPALGYVDHPPLTPLLAGLLYRVVGLELVTFRLVVGLAGAAVIVLAGLMARELGGGRFAQGTAALAALCMPVLLGTNILFQTVTFDQLIWAVAAYLLIRLLRTDDPRWWLWLGVTLGLGLLTKHTIVLFGIALGIALLLTPQRRWLATRWPYLAVALALLIASPHLIWQIANGFPTLEFIEHNSANTRDEYSRLSLIPWQLLNVGPLALPLMAGGVYWLFRAEAGRWRLLGWLVVIPPLLVVLLQAKPYYSAAILPLGCTATGVWTEQLSAVRGRRWLRLAVVGALLLNLLIPVLFLLPLLPLETADEVGVFDINGELTEMVGWDELVEQVAAVYATLPPEEQARTRILTVSYGEAGAIDLLGDANGLPQALASHNSYYYWGPDDDWDTLITVGYATQRLSPYFTTCEPAGTVTNALDLDNETNGYPILICRGLTVPRADFWEALRHFQ